MSWNNFNHPKEVGALESQSRSKSRADETIMLVSTTKIILKNKGRIKLIKDKQNNREMH